MEILVHIAAPSSAVDDARYYAHAHAIARAFDLPIHHPAADSSDELSRPANPAIEDSIGPNRPALDHSRHSPPVLDSPITVIPDSQPEPASPEPQCRDLDVKRRRLDPNPLNLGAVEQDTAPGTSSRLEGKPSPGPDVPSMIQLLPREIHPPLPPISTAPFSTHITPTLAMLARRLNPARTYHPLHRARALDQLERGYWSVQITLHDPQDPPDASPNPKAWDTQSFHRFWAFLAEFIGNDARAGWGVWCILERHPSIPALGLIGPSSGAPESVSVVLKVYAWGEVAMHVYLLLFLASERRIRGMGATWRDFRDETVIQMP